MPTSILFPGAYRIVKDMQVKDMKVTDMQVTDMQATDKQGAESEFQASVEFEVVSRVECGIVE